MFGKVLHNVYQVRAGQQLHSSSIGYKYFFAPTEVGLQVVGQTKSMVNARNHSKNHKDSEQFDAPVTHVNSVKCREDIPISNTQSLNPKSSKPLSPLEVSRRPVSKNVPVHASLKKQQIRKNRGTDWYLHHVLPSIQRTEKYHNENWQNLSIFNESSDRNLHPTRLSSQSSVHSEVKIIKQKSEQNCNISGMKMTGNNIQNRPNTVPKTRNSKFINYYLPKLSDNLYVQSATNFNLHTQSGAEMSHQSGDYNTSMSNNEGSYKNTINLESTQGNSFKCSKHQFSSVDHHKIANRVSTYSSGDGTLICDNVSSQYKAPNQFTRQINSKSMYENIPVIKQRGQLEKAKRTTSSNKEKSFEVARPKRKERELYFPIKINTGVAKNASSCLIPATHTYKDVVSSIDDINIKRLEKRVYPMHHNKLNSSTSSTLKSAVEHIERVAKNKEISFMKSKVNHKKYIMEYQKNSRYENSKLKQNKYYNPTSAHGSVPLNKLRLISTPPTKRKYYKQNMDKSKEVQSTKIISRNRTYDEQDVTDLKPDERQDIDDTHNLLASSGTTQKANPPTLKPKEGDHWKYYEGHFHEDETKHGTDEKEINHMKRKRLISSIVDNMKPKSAPKLKTKRSESELDLNEENFETPIADDVEQKVSKRSIRSMRVSQLNSDEYNSKDNISWEKKVKGLGIEETSSNNQKRARSRNTGNVNKNFDKKKKKNFKSTHIPKAQGYEDNINTTRPEHILKARKNGIPTHNTQKSKLVGNGGELLERDEQIMKAFGEDDQTKKLIQDSVTKTDLAENKNAMKHYNLSPNNNFSPQVSTKRFSERKNKTKDTKLQKTDSATDFHANRKPLEPEMITEDARKDGISNMGLVESELYKSPKRMDFEQILKHSTVKGTNLIKLQTDAFMKFSADNKNYLNWVPTRKRTKIYANLPQQRHSEQFYKNTEPDCLELERDKSVTFPNACIDKETSTEIKFKKGERKLNTLHTSKQSTNAKSHSEYYIPYTENTEDVLPQRKVKSHVAIAGKITKKENKIAKSFHDFRKKSFHKFLQKSYSFKSVKDTSQKDITSRNIFDQWRTRFRRIIKTSFFGK